VDGSGGNRGWSKQFDQKGGGNSTMSGGNNWDWKQQARSLLNPDEVMNLDARIAITFTPGVPAICSKLIRYYEEPNLGKPPGPLQRMRERMKTAMGCILILAAAILVTVCVTKAVNQQQGVQYVAPGGPAWK